MRTMKKLLVHSLWFVSCLVIILSEENEQCRLINGGKGTCIHIKNCQHALDQIPHRIKPETCWFDGLYPIVCCPNFNTNPTIEKVELEEEEHLTKKSCDQIKKLYPLNNFAPDIGTVSARSLEYLYMAAIGYGLRDDIKWYCSGALISEKHVLTAAHCLETVDLEPIRWVSLGDLDLKTDYHEAEQQTFQIVTRIKHPDYQPPQRYHDIAILELDNKVTFTMFVAPACLHLGNDLPKTTLFATGWDIGTGDLFDEDSDYLQEFRLSLINKEECGTEYIENSTNLIYGITDSQVCASGNRFRRDKFVSHKRVSSCQKPVPNFCQCNQFQLVHGYIHYSMKCPHKIVWKGDSGGPLSYQNIEATGGYRGYTIYGVASFGKAHGFVSDPTVYTKVSWYIPWIEKVLYTRDRSLDADFYYEETR